MTLPKDLITAYKSYKQNTEIIAGWLAETSSKAGYIREKKWRRRPVRTVGYQYTIAIDEFVAMADWIADKEPSTVLSTAMQRLWRATIRARRAFTERFTGKNEEDLPGDNAHAYFANVLEEALEQLKPCWESSSAANRQPDGAEVPANRFGVLNLEETADHAGDHHEVPVVPKPSLAHVVMDNPQVETDFLFGIWTFMAEVQALREHIMSVWRRYGEGHIDLMEASAALNFAVSLVRKGEADLYRTMDRPKKYYDTNKYPTSSWPSILYHEHAMVAHSAPKEVLNSPKSLYDCPCGWADSFLHFSYKMTEMYKSLLKKAKEEHDLAGDGAVPLMALPGLVQLQQKQKEVEHVQVRPKLTFPWLQYFRRRTR